MAVFGAPPLLTNQAIMDDAELYAKRVGMQPLLGEYMKRILEKRPKDPIAFLLAEIKKAPFSPPLYPQENPFYRDPSADDGAAKQAVRDGGLARFYRDGAAQCLARTRAATASGYGFPPLPMVMAHGDASIENLVQTRSGVAFSAGIQHACVAPFAVDLARCLGSLECLAAAARAARGEPRAPPHASLASYAPQLLAGYVDGLAGLPIKTAPESLGAFCDDMFFPASASTKRYLEDGCVDQRGVTTSHLAARMRTMPLATDDTKLTVAVGAFARAYAARLPEGATLAENFFEVVEAGELSRGRRLVVLKGNAPTGGEPLFLELRPRASLPPPRPDPRERDADVAAAALFGNLEIGALTGIGLLPLADTAGADLGLVAAPLEPFWIRASLPLKSSAAAGGGGGGEGGEGGAPSAEEAIVAEASKLGYVAGFQLGKAHGAGAPGGVDPLRRAALAQFDGVTNLASTVVGEAFEAHNNYMLACDAGFASQPPQPW